MTLLYSYAIFAGLGFSGAFTCIQVLIAAHYSGPLYGRVLATLVMIDTLCGALGTQTVARLKSGEATTTWRCLEWPCSLR